MTNTMKNVKYCPKCRLILPKTAFYKSKLRSDGLASLCKECNSDRCKSWNGRPEVKCMRSMRNDLYHRTTTGKFNQLKARAKKLNRMFRLTLDQYIKIISKNHCSGCGSKLPKRGAGLDRINNNKGYTAKNVQPLCGICNSIKKDRSDKWFKEYMKNKLTQNK